MSNAVIARPFASQCGVLERGKFLCDAAALPHARADTLPNRKGPVPGALLMVGDPLKSAV